MYENCGQAAISPICAAGMRLPCRPGEGRDPYAAAIVVNGTRRSSDAQQYSFVVMGPGFRRDDGECVARSVGHAPAFSRHDLSEPCFSFRPLLEEGAGKAGCRSHPWAPSKGRKLGGRTTGVTGAIRLSLRDGLRIISCSPRRDWAFLSPPSQNAFALCLGTPAARASGPHDFPVRFACSRQSHARRPPHLTATPVTMRSAPRSGETGRFIH